MAFNYVTYGIIPYNSSAIIHRILDPCTDSYNIWCGCTSDNIMVGIYKEANIDFLNGLGGWKCAKPEYMRIDSCIDINVNFDSISATTNKCPYGSFLQQIYKANGHILTYLTQFRCCNFTSTNSGEYLLNDEESDNWGVPVLDGPQSGWVDVNQDTFITGFDSDGGIELDELVTVYSRSISWNTAPPSQTPSYYPTYSPSITPTTIPTDNPTIGPTNNPTYSPSIAPTIAPTIIPSLDPTISPIDSIIKTPASNSSDNVTETPSFVPSNIPTTSPMNVQTVSINITETPTTTPTFTAINDGEIELDNDAKASLIWIPIIVSIAAILVILCCVYIAVAYKSMMKDINNISEVTTNIDSELKEPTSVSAYDGVYSDNETIVTKGGIPIQDDFKSDITDQPKQNNKLTTKGNPLKSNKNYQTPNGLIKNNNINNNINQNINVGNVGDVDMNYIVGFNETTKGYESSITDSDDDINKTSTEGMTQTTLN